MSRLRALPRALVLLALLASATLPGAAPASSASKQSLWTPSPGEVTPIRSLLDEARTTRRSAQAGQAGDTVWVFRDSLETRSSPSNEGGWTHIDASFQPQAWHIDTLMACQGHGMWCGVVDSSWVNDPNRMGYGNAWTQILDNYVDLAAAVGPVNLSFRHQMDTEAGFDLTNVEVLDPDYSWIQIAGFSGVIHGTGGAPCDTFTAQIPDSIIAKYASPVPFRFVFTSDLAGSSADGLYTGDGWSLDNVTVMAGLNDLRFFDDFESGIGTWGVSTFPPVGDNWRIASNVPSEQLCTTNPTKVWLDTSAASGSLLPRMDNKLVSPVVAVNRADRVFLAFDVYRNLPLLSCFYYNIQLRTRNVGDPVWSGWITPTSQIYFGNEKEWQRQTLSLPGASVKDSVQFMVDVKDYSQIYCDGVSTPGGTTVLFDNFAVGVIGLAPPTLVVSDQDLFNDTFETAAFLSDDNFNTSRGDSTAVRLSVSRGLKSAALRYSLNGGSFASAPLAAVGSLFPTAYYADLPAGSYPRGTELRYYFSVTDSLDATATLPSDALASSHYYAATILPAAQTASTTCPGDSARVLYVNAFAGPDAVTGIDQSLTAIGARYDRYDVNAPANSLGNSPGGAPPGDLVRHWPGVPASALSSYSAIVWDVGDRSSATLSHEDQQLLTTWLKLSGRNRGLLLAGDNLAYDLAANQQDIGNFLTCTLGVLYARDIWETVPQDTLTPTLSGAAGTRIASEPFPISGVCPGMNRFDAFLSSSCAGAKARTWLAYPNSLIAAIERQDSVGVVADSSRSILLGFGLDTMTDRVRRNLFLYRTLANEFEVPSCYVTSAVETPSKAAAPVVRLYAAAPNPFNPSTAIRFELGRPAHVRLQVFDVSGALVRTLLDGVLTSGPHRVLWDGRDDRARDLASGAYFYRIEAENASQARKLILLR